MAGAMRKMGVYLGLVEDEDRYDEYDDYDEYDEDDDDAAGVRPSRRAPSRRGRPAPRDETCALAAPRSRRRADARVVTDPSSYRITTLHPRTYNEARTIGEHFREGTPVIMNLTEMDDADAKRLVDFAAGLIFGLHGTIERVTQQGVPAVARSNVDGHRRGQGPHRRGRVLQPVLTGARVG